MRAEFYLVIQGVKRSTYSSFRYLGTVQVRKTKPSTRSDELALRLTIDIPDALFEKPALETTITVPDAAQRGEVITANVCDNIAEIIRERTGLTVHVRAADEPDTGEGEG